MSEFKLTDKQTEQLQLIGGNAQNVLNFGGARGGKTFGYLYAMCVRAIAAPGSRHLAARLRYNAVKRAIRLDTLPKVMRLAFPGVPVKSHDQDGYVSIGKAGQESEIWFAGLDSAERIDKILGMEFATILLNEASEIPYATAATVRTRLAQKILVPQTQKFLRPRLLVDLNPVGSKHWTYQEFILKKSPETGLPIKDPHNYVFMSTKPQDNEVNLAEGFIDNLDNLPMLQRKRFFLGEYNTEVDGALWQHYMFKRCLVHPHLTRIVIAVDPSGAKSNVDQKSDEIGIVVVGLGVDGRGYVLADLSLRAGPSMWARVVANAYRRYQADAVVVETNYGGPMAAALINSVDPTVKIISRSASRGKHIRAEPIAALYEKGMISHVGTEDDYELLEEQYGQFTSAGWMGVGSPDRADAAVWAINELFIDKTVISPAGAVAMQ